MFSKIWIWKQCVDLFFCDINAGVQIYSEILNVLLWLFLPKSFFVWHSGRRMWRFTGGVLDPTFPRMSSDLGLPRHPDCAFYYAPLGHMVLFKRSRYFVFNLKILRQEPYYPRRLTDWTGVPPGTNGALTRSDGRLYLFKDRQFWRFDPGKLQVTKEGQWAEDLSWTGCSNLPQSNNILWPAEGAGRIKVQFVWGRNCSLCGSELDVDFMINVEALTLFILLNGCLCVITALLMLWCCWFDQRKSFRFCVFFHCFYNSNNFLSNNFA